METYHIHDNGARPYKVTVHHNIVKVYLAMEQLGDDSEGDEDFHEYPKYVFDTHRVFIGESPLNEMTRFSGGYGDSYKGNSLLLQMSELRYIHIGAGIISFKAHRKIVEFVSPVGNNDVPYPYAIDYENNVYLLIENVMLKASHFTFNGTCPYRYYYDSNKITTDFGTVPPTKPVAPNFIDITKFYIGEEQYTMRYKPFAKKEYKRLINAFDSFLNIEQNGKRVAITKKKYAKIMRKFGKLMGYKPLKTTTIRERHS